MSAPSDDPELRALFVDEFRRHVTTFRRAAVDGASRASTLHAMRGAAAMMGLTDVAAFLSELEQQTRAGDVDVALRSFPKLDELLRDADFQVDVLRGSDIRSSAPPTIIPGERISGPGTNPPSADRASLDPDVLAYFFSEAHARVEKFGEALVALARPDSREALDDAFRHVHSIKGAASTVGLSSIARGAHALEASLIALKSLGRDLTSAELELLRAARARLSVALASPESAAAEAEVMVGALRVAGLVREHDLQPVSRLERDRARNSPALDVIRVPVQAVAGLSESVAEFGSVGDRIVMHSSSVREFARGMAQYSRVVQDALHRIGPPRPWGAPADALDRLSSVARSLAESSSELDREGERLGHDAELLGSLAGGARDSLQRLGASSARWLFDRVAPAAETLARHENKEVMILRAGEDVEIARELAERLVEPLTQLVRNAVTHGLEAPATRLARSKPARATLKLSATVESARLRLTVEDDGAGVDIDAASERAIALKILNRRAAKDPSAVLSSLFVPGLSTRPHANTAAGRGIGLDLVHREIAQIGGEITLTSRRGAYTRFTIEITMRPLAQRMLVVIAAGERFAVPLERVAKVIASPSDVGPVPIVALSHALRISTLPAANSSQGGAIVMLNTNAGTLLGIGVDGVERAREFVVRRLPPLIAELKPWLSTTVDGEGRVILVIDVDELKASS